MTIFISYKQKYYMIIIHVGKNESIDKALKRYKYRVFMSKQIEVLRERQQFEKKSSKKRKSKLKAIYIQTKKDSK